MARPRVGPKGAEIRHKPGAERVEVDIAHQVFEVGILLTDNRFIAVLKEMSGTFVPAIKTGGVSGQKSCHNRRQRHCTGAKQQVCVFCKEHPCVTDCPGFRKKIAAPSKKVPSIGKASKDGSPFYSSDDDMMEDSRSVETGSARHDGWYHW